MNDYSMSDDLFRQRALEEDGCVITALGSALVNMMKFDGVSAAVTEEADSFDQGKSHGANYGG